MKSNTEERHITRRGLFSLSSGRVVSEMTKPRAEMTRSERVSSDRRAVTHSMAAARTARVFADQQTQNFIKNSQPSKNPHDRLRLSRRTFLAASAATIATTKAFADTPFTSFAFPGTGFPTSRTMPARIADIFNILDFGADPTGVSDSQPAFQAAITAASNNGIIFGPNGAYKTLSPILIPVGLSLQFIGEGSSITANFNGFVFDNLSSPYNAVSGVSVIERWLIQNSFSGNNFSVTANDTWSASGSPVTITLSGLDPGVVAGGAFWVSDTRLSNNSVFIGMITGVSWPDVTVASTAVASGATSDLGVRILQCYPAGASWSNGAATITMAATRPAGIGTGLYYVYNYESFVTDPKHDFPIGVASWSGTTVTFVPGYGGVGGASTGSADRLWFAPVAGCIRYSSVVGATVRNCNLSGFIGLTTSQDKIVPNDPTVGAAEGFHVVADTCNFSNPSGFSGLMGQTGIYYQNNSISINSNHNSMWCAERLSGTSCGIIGGRAEICYFAIIIGGDTTASNNSLSNGFIEGRSLESNLLGIYGKSGSAVIKSTGASSFALPSTSLGGFYFNAFAGAVINSGAGGNFGSAYAIYVANPNNNRTNLTFTSAFASNFSTPSSSWRTPPQAWAATYIQCLSWDGVNQIAFNPTYLYANLPGVSTNPDAIEGDEFNISDGTNGLGWGDVATDTGTHTTHYLVRYNGTDWTVMGK